MTMTLLMVESMLPSLEPDQGFMTASIKRRQQEQSYVTSEARP